MAFQGNYYKTAFAKLIFLLHNKTLKLDVQIAKHVSLE